MSIPVLHQVFDETRRLAIAGSNLAQGDFRLKKLIPALEKSDKKAPVFAKVAEAAQAVVDAKPKESAEALLDLSSLTMAILYTQGELGATGKLTPIKPVGVQLTSTQTPARLLKPVIEALTSTGSGRLEVVKEAHDRGAFKDPRLVNHAISGLDDVYAELADFMEQKVVVQYGQAIIPLIVDRIDLSGRAGNARRLRLLHHLDPKRARPLVLEAFEKGSKEMKLAGLACLGDSKEDLEPLIEQTSAKAADVRRVAFRRLIRFDTPEALDVLAAGLDGKDGSDICYYYRGSKSKKLLARQLEKWNAAFDSLLEIEVKQRMKPADKKEMEKRFKLLMVVSYSLPMRADAGVEKCVKRVLADHESLLRYKGGYDDGGDLVDWAARWVAHVGKPPLKKQLAEMYDTMPAIAHEECFDAAIEVYSPKEFFDKYISLYFEDPKRENGKKRTKREVTDLKEALVSTITERSPSNVWDDYFDEEYDYESMYDEEYFYRFPRRKPKDVKLDPRWVKEAVEEKDEELLLSIVAPGQKVGLDYLAAEIDKLLAKKKVDDLWDAMRLIKKITMCGDKRGYDYLVALLQKVDDQRKKTKNPPKYGYYGLWWVADTLPYLTAAQCKKLEASLEGMHDSIVDEMLVQIRRAEELRGKKKKKRK